MKNKLKIQNYAVWKCKNSAKKTTGQWTSISIQGDQRARGVLTGSEAIKGYYGSLGG